MYENLIEKISERAAFIKNDNDYIKNNLLHCGICHEPKQKVIEHPCRFTIDMLQLEKKNSK